MTIGCRWKLFAAVLVSAIVGRADAQPSKTRDPDSKALLSRAAKEGKYVFFFFYKEQDASAQLMDRVLRESLASRSGDAIIASVRADDPAEKELVAAYGVDRARMPVTVAVAPNGALTGIFSHRLTPDKIAEAFVTPVMAEVMKGLQANQAILLTVLGSDNTSSPAVAKELEHDPVFKRRTKVMTVSAADPTESMFMRQLEIDPSEKTTQLVILAPPALLVGKFDCTATKKQIAAAISKAGECCGDPRCKHHQTSSQTSRQQGNASKR